MSTFEPTEFRSYQVGAAWTQPEAIKAVNVKPDKSNYHVAVVMSVLYEMYPHPNKRDMDVYDAYMNKAVRQYQASIGHPTTGVITPEELAMLAEQTGRFRLV